jgi:hypothetical protein
VDLTPLAKHRLHTLAHRKRWIYVAVASEEILAALAVAELGYVATSFAFVYERASGRLLADRSAMAPPFMVRVGDRAGEGHATRFRAPGASVRVERAAGAGAYAVDAEFRGLKLWAHLDAAAAPPALSAVVPLGVTRGGQLVNATEKRALLPVRGDVTVAGRRFSLDGALAGYDYTHGLLARHTAWKWAFGLGHARGGERVAFNLTEGFVGERECAAWVGDALVPLGAARFEFAPERPLDPWRVRTDDGAVDLRFVPGGMHAERKNLGLVASRFVQAAGAWSGLLRVPGHELALEGVLGVTEDQDVLW